MRFWQRAGHARNTAAAFILLTPAFVPAAATAIVTFIVAEYQVETIRKAREQVFEIGETALSKAFVGAVDHMARVHADHRKMQEVQKPVPDKVTIAPVCVAPTVVKSPSPPPPRQDGKPPVTKPTAKKPARWRKPRRKSPPADCACSADDAGEWTNRPSYRPGFYGTAPDYREPLYGEEN